MTDSAANKRSNPSLPAFSTFVLAILLLLPATRWMVLQQLRMVFERPAALVTLMQDLGIKDEIASGPGLRNMVDSEREAAARYANDLQLQMAFASAGNLSADQKVIRLRELIPQFPKSPALYATILRYMCSRQIRTGRTEEYLLTGDQPPPSYASNTSDPGAYDLFDQLAAKGEALDSGNGYFPTLRAIGLFGRHKDSEGLAALMRASQCVRWEGYFADEAHGNLRLWEEAAGMRGAFNKAAVYAAILYPEYARVRGAARVALYLAIVSEQDGRVGEGVNIRHSIMALGALMRAESRSGIGSLVGCALTKMATSRPGGIPPEKPDASTDIDDVRRLGMYRKFLHSIGRSTEEAWAQSEFEKSVLAREIVTKGIKQSALAGKPIRQLMVYWSADALMVTDIFWLALLGILAGILARSRFASGPSPVILAMIIFACLVYFTWNSRATEILAAYGQVIDNLTARETGFALPPGLIRIATVGAALIVPLLTVGIGIVVRYTRKISLSAGLASAAIRAASLIVLLYAVHVAITVNQERVVDDGLERMLQHEGRYCAELVGKSWPAK